MGADQTKHTCYEHPQYKQEVLPVISYWCFFSPHMLSLISLPSNATLWINVLLGPRMAMARGTLYFHPCFFAQVYPPLLPYWAQRTSAVWPFPIISPKSTDSGVREHGLRSQLHHLLMQEVLWCPSCLSFLIYKMGSKALPFSQSCCGDSVTP